MSLGGSQVGQPRTWVRAINVLIAGALAAIVLAIYWPTVRVLDLHTADLMYRGEWIGGHAMLIESVTAGGPTDRSGLRAGDALLFDPSRKEDWILAGYREMPEGFTGNLPVRHADGTQSTVMLAPVRAAYALTLNDRLALPARLAGMTLALFVGVLLIWARPCLMTWSFFLTVVSSGPARVLGQYLWAFSEPAVGRLLTPVATALFALTLFLVPFALSFPRNTVPGWQRWHRALGCAVVVTAATYFALMTVRPFVSDESLSLAVYAPMSFVVEIAALFALVRTYRRSEVRERALLKWAILGCASTVVAFFIGSVFNILVQVSSNPRVGGPVTPVHWVMFTGQGLFLPLTIGYAVLRVRVLDVQFAVSRTVVYGIVSTIVLVFLAVLHWLLGRVIEHSRLAFGLEGLAAVGLGLVLHRTSHRINHLVDRVLFRKHHAAEERLRQITTALPYATTERSIAEALVSEPARNLDLASAALFYRASAEGPLTRVLSHGWSDHHMMSLDAESMLVRYLQAEHDPLRLEDVQWLPEGMPEGIAHPVLASPIVNQHTLTAVVLYGSHVNGTLLDPDEIDLLSALAKAAATSHQQVRIATLTREKEAAEREKAELERGKALAEREAAIQKARNDQLEVSTAELRELVRMRVANTGEGT